MTGAIDVHHHVLPDPFWRETNDAHSPVGGIAPAPCSAGLMLLSSMDEAGIERLSAADAAMDIGAFLRDRLS